MPQPKHSSIHKMMQSTSTLRQPCHIVTRCLVSLAIVVVAHIPVIFCTPSDYRAARLFSTASQQADISNSTTSTYLSGDYRGKYTTINSNNVQSIANNQSEHTNRNSEVSTPSTTISEEANALMYLQKYGYMNAHSNSEVNNLISEESLSSAIVSFQRFAGIPETGNLDDETRRYMKMPRCGNPDQPANENKTTNPFGAQQVISSKLQLDNINENDPHSNPNNSHQSLHKNNHSSQSDANIHREGPNLRALFRKRRYALQGSKWRRQELTYRISQYPTRFNSKRHEVDAQISKAFGIWSQVAPIDFIVKKDGRVHIDIRFASGDHGDGDAFDGPGNTLAHAYFPQYGGDAHFDDQEYWTIDSYTGTNIFQVAAHELGHSLGLGHSNVREALMAPFYQKYKPNFKLHLDDIHAIQALYGEKSFISADVPQEIHNKSKGFSFGSRPASGLPGMFDGTHRYPSIIPIATTTTQPTTPSTTTTSTIPPIDIFGSDRNRPTSSGRPSWFGGSIPKFQPEKGEDEGSASAGGPHRTLPDFGGEDTINSNVNPFTDNENRGPILPGNVDSENLPNGNGGIKPFSDASPYPIDLCMDSVIDAITRTEDGRTYMFKGDFYWLLNSEGLARGFPRKISEDWEGLTGPIDAALTWADGKTFFFKGNKYWRFRNQKRELGYPKRISSGFSGIPDDIDAAFVWSGNGRTYFFKGTEYWRFDSKADPPVSAEYPRSIKVWNGVPYYINAAFKWENNVTYFFKGSQYYRFNDREFMVETRGRPSFPRLTSEWWFGCSTSNNLAQKALPNEAVSTLFSHQPIAMFLLIAFFSVHQLALRLEAHELVGSYSRKSWFFHNILSLNRLN